MGYTLFIIKYFYMTRCLFVDDIQKATIDKLPQQIKGIADW